MDRKLGLACNLLGCMAIRYMDGYLFIISKTCRHDMVSGSGVSTVDIMEGSRTSTSVVRKVKLPEGQPGLRRLGSSAPQPPEKGEIVLNYVPRYSGRLNASSDVSSEVQNAPNYAQEQNS